MNGNDSKLKIHEKVLLDLLANSLFDAGRTVDFDVVNLNAVWYESNLQAVSLMAFSKTDSSLFQNEKFSHIRKKLNQAFADNAKIDFEHIRIHRIMTQAGIPYMILKGFASALYYRDPLLRSMGDVDFLVSPRCLEAADEVLKKHGYESTDKNRAFHDVYIGNGCRCEMHFEPAGIPEGKAGETVREYLNDALECSCEVKTEVGTMVVPSVFHHGLIILLHMCHHLTGEGLGLRHLCDWAVFISPMDNDEFCNIFEEKLKQIGLWKFAQIMAQISVEYLGCPEKEWAGEVDRQLAEKVLHDIFKGGNFGQKSSDRSHESLLISSKTEQENSMLKQFFISANSIVYSNWSIAKKFKILLPVGWVFFGGRYLIRSFFGKRPKVRLKKVTQEATERKELYAQLKLFERADIGGR